MADNPRQIAVDIQTRFNFYVLALTFGILALSVQTAVFDGRPIPARIAELAAWVLLLTSGLVGLRRLEWFPHLYEIDAIASDVMERKQSLKKVQLEGASSIHVLAENRQRSVQELLARADSDMERVVGRQKDLRKWTQIKYRAQQATFIGGVIALVVGRGYKPLMDIIHAISP